MWLIDPKNGKKSVTLTMFVISYLILMTCSILQVFGKINDVSSFMNVFIACSTLYLGRKFKFNKDEIQMIDKTQTTERGTND